MWNQISVDDAQHIPFLTELSDGIQDEIIQLLIGPDHLAKWVKVKRRKAALESYHLMIKYGSEMVKAIREWIHVLDDADGEFVGGPPLTAFILGINEKSKVFYFQKTRFRGIMKEKTGDFDGYFRVLSDELDW